MLAAKLYGPGDVRVVECEVPSITEDEILLKTGAAAICGSDLRMIANGYKGVDEAHSLTLGHEFSGVIEKVGTRVEGYAPGMHVSVAPNYGCGVCDACVAGNTHLCNTYEAFGINIDGGFAEYVRLPQKAITQGNVMVLDKNIPFAVAAAFEPMSCVFNGQERTGVHINDTVLVIGAGPIGVMHALLARIYGASRVYVRDFSEERMRAAAAIDAHIVPLYGADTQAEIMQLTDGRGVDVCITAAPAPDAQAQALHYMAMNGRVLFFGGLPAGKDNVSLATNIIHYKQLAIHGSTRANTRQYRQVAKLCEAGTLNLAPLISASYPLARFAEAVEYTKSAKGLKTVIAFGI